MVPKLKKEPAESSGPQADRHFFTGSIFKRLSLMTLAAISCFSLRLGPVKNIDADNDESLYSTGVGLLYSEYMRRGEIGKIMESRENYEHPPLVKLIYGAGLALSPRPRSPEEALRACRLVSASLAGLECALLFLISPFAALFFAVDPWQIYYSSKAFLDGPGSLFAFSAVLFFLLAGREWNWKSMFSGLLAGGAMAAKYINAPTVCTLFVFAAIAFRKEPKRILLYAFSALLVFYLLNPTVWAHPLQRLSQSFSFHQFQSGDSALYNRYLQRFGKKPQPWTPLEWLAQNRISYQPERIPLGYGRVIFIFSLLGLPFLWRRSPFLFVWTLANLVFLVLYPIKWPHYLLIFIPGMALSAAQVFESAIPSIFQKLEPKRISPPWLKAEWAAAILLGAAGSYGFAFARRDFHPPPDFSKAYNDYASTLLKLGRTDEAASYFRRELGKSGELDVAAHLNLANLLLEKGGLEEAKSEVQEALKVQPDNFAGLLILGNILLSQGRPEEALAEYRKVDETRIVDPINRGDLYHNLGTAFLAMKDVPRAVEMLEKSLRYKPDEPLARNQLGNAYFKLGKLDEAGQQFAEVVRIDPSDWQGRRNLGIVFAQKREHVKAIHEWEKVLVIKPGDPETRAYIDRARHQ